MSVRILPFPGGGDPVVTLAHGSGGRAMRDLIEGLIVPAFRNRYLDEFEDQARIGIAELAGLGDRIAFTTDTFVVSPLFFPGADIGKLAICGTINDLAVAGAVPLYLSCGLVVEEGFPTTDLARVVASMSQAAQAGGVAIVTGDTKVVNRGAADKLFINTAGIGVVPRGVNIAARRARTGDAVIVSGTLGDHGVAILIARNELALQGEVCSDCQPLAGLVRTMLDACPDLHCLRDATRGGVATVLNEFAAASNAGIVIRERDLPVRDEVRGACGILGLEPLYLANEGKLVAVAPAGSAPALLAAMRSHPAGRDAAIIGTVTDEPAGSVILATAFGGDRILDMPIGELLPRIC